jgi:phosphoglycerate dehydrogenase-like enzyme
VQGSDRDLVVSVPTEELRSALEGTDGLDLLVWDLRSAPPRDAIDLVVVPYMSPPELLRNLDGVQTRLVQSQSIGYDGVPEALPPHVRFANGAGIHEASTAELTIGLMIASQRRFPAYVHAQSKGTWAHEGSAALTDSRVLVIGQGGVGRAINDRLRPFEVDLVRVATTRRTDDHGAVHGMPELGDLLGTADIVVLAVPLTDQTRGMVDAEFLRLMPRGSLLVNVARGAVVVTDDLVDAVRSGHVRAALDVVDPEPLPPDHPLWSLEGVLVTPHVGGHSSAMHPRVVRLVRAQIAALRDDVEPVNVVIEPTI